MEPICRPRGRLAARSRGRASGRARRTRTKELCSRSSPTSCSRFTHWSPMGGSEDKPENYHTVTYELAERGGETALTLKQDNNASQEEADAMAENNWGPVLEGLKAVAEKER